MHADKNILVEFKKRQRRDRRHRTDRGCYPSIALNDSGTAVEVNHKMATNLMFYRVGESKNEFIEWKSSNHPEPPRKYYYGSGAYPRVSLNNDNTVIEVHNGQYLNRCYYRIGDVDTTTKGISWGPSMFFNTGLHPDVTLNNGNTVIVLFQNNIFMRHLYYRIGQRRLGKNEVGWISKKHKAGIVAEHFSLDMNDSDVVVLSLQTPFNHHIHYMVGVVNINEGVVEWCRSIHRSVGFTPSVSINNQNQVIMIHQSLMKRHLVSNVGVAKWSDEFKGIVWSSGKKSLNYHYGKGVHPSVTLNNLGKVVEVHEPRVSPNRNKLHYYSGEIQSC
jgi:hypothetical protein